MRPPTRGRPIKCTYSAKYALSVANDKYGGSNTTYENNVTGLGRESAGSQGAAGGGALTLANVTYLEDNGDYLLVGHDGGSGATSSSGDLPSGVNSRLVRIWYADKTDVTTAGGYVTVAFDTSAAGVSTGTFSNSHYRLLYRAGTSGSFSEVTVESTRVQNTDEIAFIVDATQISDGYYTLGSTAYMTTRVTLRELRAVSVAAGTKILWRTGFEEDNLGFHVYRDVHNNGRDLVRLTQIPLAGSALLAQGTLPRGWSYSFLDRGSHAGRYYLEDVDLSGRRTRHGPVSATATAAPSPAPATPPVAVTLAEVGREGTAPTTHGVEATARSEDPERHRQVVSGEAIKIEIDREGWVHIPQPDLVGAGLDPAVDPRLLHLYARGVEQPIVVDGEVDGRFDPYDELALYGIPRDDDYAASEVYWLRVESTTGARRRDVDAPADRLTLRARPRSIYFAALLNGTGSNFFGPVVCPESVEFTFDVHHPAAVPDATLEIALQGVSAGVHLVDVFLDGLPVGLLSFADRNRGTLSVALGAATLAGSHRVSLSADSDADVSLVEQIELRYFHDDRFEDAILRGRYTLAPHLGLDVVDAAVGADMLVVTASPVADALLPLIERRRAQGLQVAVIDMVDIDDAFGYGGRSMDGLAGFLASVWHASSPSLVLLFGDASLDPRGYLGQGQFDLVPTRMVDTFFLQTASDSALADVDGDSFAEMAIGRIPVRTREEATTVVAKLLAYENGAMVGRADSALLIADANEGYPFSLYAEAMSQHFGERSVTTVDVGTANADEIKMRLLHELQEGYGIVDYLGHGSVGVWAHNLLTSEEALLQESARPSLFVSMTCLTGMFNDVFLQSLAEALLLAPRGGAMAVLASSGVTGAEAQVDLNRVLLKELVDDTLPIGVALRRAMPSVSDVDVRQTFNLLGDPSMRLLRPAGADGSGCGCRIAMRQSQDEAWSGALLLALLLVAGFVGMRAITNRAPR